MIEDILNTVQNFVGTHHFNWQYLLALLPMGLWVRQRPSSFSWITLLATAGGLTSYAVLGNAASWQTAGLSAGLATLLGSVLPEIYSVIRNAIHDGIRALLRPKPLLYGFGTVIIIAASQNPILFQPLLQNIILLLVIGFGFRFLFKGITGGNKKSRKKR